MARGRNCKRAGSGRERRSGVRMRRRRKRRQMEETGRFGVRKMWRFPAVGFYFLIKFEESGTWEKPGWKFHEKA